MCLPTLVLLTVLILLLMADFWLSWHREEGKESQRLFLSFLRNRPLRSSACFAGLPSKGLNAPLFFFLLTSLQSPSFSFCAHTQWAICRKLNSFNRKKNQGRSLMNTPFYQKGQLVRSSSFTSHSCPLSCTSLGLLQLNRMKKIISVKENSSYFSSFTPQAIVLA